MPAETTVHHPIFARLYDRLSAVMEANGAAEHRAEMLTGVHGRIIEVGAGNGYNFGHYPDTVTEVIAVEPEPYLRARAEEAARNAPVPITVVDGTADALPVDTDTADVVVFSLVLCSVPDQATALAEARRVLKPGGEVRFFEHVAAQSPGLARFQRNIDVVWPRLGGGCHTSRDTAQAIADAGLAVENIRRFTFAPSVLTKPVAPHMIAVAREPRT